MSRALTALFGCVVCFGLLSGAEANGGQSSADVALARLMRQGNGVYVVAHRGCHNASPRDHMGDAPENSAAALENCVRLGVDMMELDVHRTRDGALVIMHDDTVDRTTNGQGAVKDLTLAQLKSLRLKRNRGSFMSPTLTDEKVLTLAEILNLAKGRIMLNLDIKSDVYDQAMAETTAAGMTKYVVIKKEIQPSDTALTAQAPFDAAPSAFILRGKGTSDDVAALGQAIERQTSASVKPVGVEVGSVNFDELAAIVKHAKASNIKVWCNTLDEVGAVSVIDIGGDVDSLRTEGIIWKTLIDRGVNIIQTDEPGPLLRFLRHHHQR